MCCAQQRGARLGARGYFSTSSELSFREACLADCFYGGMSEGIIGYELLSWI
jgi:hypothetical protein